MEQIFLTQWSSSFYAMSRTLSCDLMLHTEKYDNHKGL